RVQVNTHVVDVAHLRQVVAEQPLDHGETLGPHVHRRSERPVLVAVDRFEDRVSLPQVDEVLRDDVDVVAVGVQRRYAQLGSSLSVVPVVIIGQMWATLSSPSTRTRPRVMVVLPAAESPTT